MRPHEEGGRIAGDAELPADRFGRLVPPHPSAAQVRDESFDARPPARSTVGSVVIPVHDPPLRGHSSMLPRDTMNGVDLCKYCANMKSRGTGPSGTSGLRGAAAPRERGEGPSARSRHGAKAERVRTRSREGRSRRPRTGPVRDRPSLLARAVAPGKGASAAHGPRPRPGLAGRHGATRGARKRGARIVDQRNRDCSTAGPGSGGSRRMFATTARHPFARRRHLYRPTAHEMRDRRDHEHDSGTDHSRAHRL
jgi:hypothetical protein